MPVGNAFTNWSPCKYENPVVWLYASSFPLSPLLLFLSFSLLIYLMFGLRRDQHITPYQHHLGWWLSMINRRRYFLGIERYKIFDSTAPDYLFKNFVRMNDSLRRSARVALPQTFEVLIHQKQAYRGLFHLARIYLWKSLLFQRFETILFRRVGTRKAAQSIVSGVKNEQ